MGVLFIPTLQFQILIQELNIRVLNNKQNVLYVDNCISKQNEAIQLFIEGYIENVHTCRYYVLQVSVKLQYFIVTFSEVRELKLLPTLSKL